MQSGQEIFLFFFVYKPDIIYTWGQSPSTSNHTISQQPESAIAIRGTLKHIKCETQKFPDWPCGALTGRSEAARSEVPLYIFFFWWISVVNVAVRERWIFVQLTFKSVELSTVCDRCNPVKWQALWGKEFVLTFLLISRIGRWDFLNAKISFPSLHYNTNDWIPFTFQKWPNSVKHFERSDHQFPVRMKIWKTNASSHP